MIWPCCDTTVSQPCLDMLFQNCTYCAPSDSATSVPQLCFLPQPCPSRTPTVPTHVFPTKMLNVHDNIHPNLWFAPAVPQLIISSYPFCVSTYCPKITPAVFQVILPLLCPYYTFNPNLAHTCIPNKKKMFMNKIAPNVRFP